jgi:hypothetical protein
MDLTGWKTKTAGLLSITYGGLGILLGLHEADTGMQFVVNGLGILGIGHKIEKIGQ